VPDFSVLDNVPQMHATRGDRITIKANYELIIDNLLGLSHTSYLHEGTLGNRDTVESEIAIEQEGDDVIVISAVMPATQRLFAILMPSQLTADVNAQIQDRISTARRFAFEQEDAPVIEAQQQIIDDADASPDPIILAIDVGPARYKQVLQKLIRAEQSQRKGPLPPPHMAEGRLPENG
jgi:hypothetical protein